MPNRPQATDFTVQPDSGAELAAGVSATPAAKWSKPVVSVYGDVRALTMGVSNPPGESGAEGSRRPV